MANPFIILVEMQVFCSVSEVGALDPVLNSLSRRLNGQYDFIEEENFPHFHFTMGFSFSGASTKSKHANKKVSRLTPRQVEKRMEELGKELRKFIWMQTKSYYDIYQSIQCTNDKSVNTYTISTSINDYNDYMIDRII